MSDGLAGSLGLIVGLVIGALGVWLRLRWTYGSVKAQRERILKEAEAARERRLRDAEIDAKEAALELQKEQERALQTRRDELAEREGELRERESRLEHRAEQLDRRDRELRDSESELEAAKEQAQKSLHEAEAELSQAKEQLEKAATLSASEAREELVRRVEEEARHEAANRVRQIEAQIRQQARERSTEILAAAIQRYAGEIVASATVSVVELPSDDMKGRIIGREGRNIRAIEAATGVDLIIDDTPGVVVLSAFNPVRRETAKLALEELVADGRIHPARIEEAVEHAREQLRENTIRRGEQAVLDLGLQTVHAELVELLGQLHYRSLGGQNLLRHTVETGFIAGLMAAELGLDTTVAKRAGLLHEIGKAVNHEVEGHHAEIAAEWARRYGEKPSVVEAIRGYYELEPSNVYSVLLQAADTLSRSRPGVRREILETYIKRLDDLERISLGFRGVSQAFALQAGREVRVMVDCAEVAEGETLLLSRDIARRIEDELTYPGEVRVTVIRESRATEVAQ